MYVCIFVENEAYHTLYYSLNNLMFVETQSQNQSSVFFQYHRIRFLRYFAEAYWFLLPLDSWFLSNKISSWGSNQFVVFIISKRSSNVLNFFCFFGALLQRTDDFRRTLRTALARANQSAIDYILWEIFHT